MLRGEQGLSRAELADLAGIPPDHLAEIEGGNAHPSPDRLADLAQALDISPSDLVSLATRSMRGDEAAAKDAGDDRPQRRVRSFVMPLMGGEWEATPGGEPEGPRRTEP